MTLELFEMDGLTLAATLDLPDVDELPKVALWNKRAFVLLTSTGCVTASYVEVVSLRLELPAGAVH